MARIWHENVRSTLHDNWKHEMHHACDHVFAELNDRVRDAAAIPQDRALDPKRMQAMCRAALGEMLD